MDLFLQIEILANHKRYLYRISIKIGNTRKNVFLKVKKDLCLNEAF